MVAPLQNAAMNFRVQCFDAAIQNFGVPGVSGDIRHRHTRLSQGGGGAAGGEDFHSQRHQSLGEFDEAGFVGDTEQGALDFHVESIFHKSKRVEKFYFNGMCWGSSKRPSKHLANGCGLLATRYMSRARSSIFPS